jgi:rhomboid protease GluP
MFVNVSIYIIMVLSFGSTSFSSDQILQWGAQYYYDIDNGQYWRIFTSNYVHISFLHILFNMMALYYWGRSISPRFGALELFIIYTLSGVLGGIFSYVPHENIVSAGASGAISGLLGSMLILHLKGCSEFNRPYIVQNIVLNVFIALVSPVDWKAHLGGFVGGAVWTAVRFDARNFQGDGTLPE